MSPHDHEIMVRTSERRDFARCGQKWWWGYVDRLKPNVVAAPLSFGDLVHQALALYYIPGKKRGPDPAESFVRLWEELSDQIYGVYDDDGKFLDAFDLGCEMLINYREIAKRQDVEIEVIAPEQTFQIDINDSENGDYICTYVGTVDAIIRNLRTMKIGLFEHKTSKGLPPDYWLPMDEQGGSYWAMTPPWLHDHGILKPGEDLDFILYNFLKKKMADTRKKNEAGLSLNLNGEVSKNQPGPLFYRELVYRNPEARNALISRVEWQATEMQWVREGVLPVLKNPTKDCRWDCQFKDMCELHENGADWEAFRDAMFHTWKPYEAHTPIPTEEAR